MKNNFRILLLTFVLAHFGIITKMNVQGQIPKTDSISELFIDPVDIALFSIQRKSMYVNLPDKLRGTGLGLIKLHLNHNGKVLRMDIQKLRILLNDGKKIDFSNVYSSSHYPPQIQEYYIYLKKHVGSIKITPATSINSPDKSFVSFLVRFKK